MEATPGVARSAHCEHMLAIDQDALQRSLASPWMQRELPQQRLQCQKCDTCMPALWLCTHAGCAFRGCLDHMKEHCEETHQACWLHLSYGRLHCDTCQVSTRSLVNLESSFAPAIHALRGCGNNATGILSGRRCSESCGRRGFKNMGNTCYLSAALHALSNCRPLSRYLRAMAELRDTLPPHQPLLYSLSSLWAELWDSDETGPLTPKDVMQCIRRANRNFRNNEQQDSHELLRWLLDALHEETKCALPEGDDESKQGSWSVFSELFRGELVSECVCMSNSCGHTSETYEHFTDLSLPIPDQRQRDKLNGFDVEEEDKTEPQRSWTSWFSCGRSRVANPVKPLGLESCLATFFLLEDLTGDEKVECDKCKQKVECQKRFKISKLPEVLCLHVKRFKYTNSGACTKLSSMLQYEQEGLDLGSFCTEDCPDRAEASYSLFGVVSHSGSCMSGHYVSYAKNYSDGSWYKFDDSKVTLFNGANLSKVEPYMMFYTRTTFAQKEQQRMQVFAAGSALKPEAGESRFVSAEWCAQWSCLAKVPAVVNQNVVCKHNQMKIPTLQGLQSQLVEVQPDFWERLQSSDCCPAITAEMACAPCTVCEEELELEVEKRKKEKERVTGSDSASIDVDNGNPYWYIVSSPWLGRWRAYTQGDGRAPAPGPISNGDLLDEQGNPLPGLKRVQHYRGINVRTWEIFVELHGGGPEIRRELLDIYAPAPDGQPSATAQVGVPSMKPDPPV